jgi:hypothetical protein
VTTSSIFAVRASILAERAENLQTTIAMLVTMVRAIPMEDKNRAMAGKEMVEST